MSAWRLRSSWKMMNAMNDLNKKKFCGIFFKPTTILSDPLGCPRRKYKFCWCQPFFLLEVHDGGPSII